MVTFPLLPLTGLILILFARVASHVTDFNVNVTVDSQFNSHKSGQKLFQNLLIIFSNSLMGFKVIYQLEKELLKGDAKAKNRGVETFYTHYLMLLY